MDHARGADDVQPVIAHHPGGIRWEGTFARRDVESSFLVFSSLLVQAVKRNLGRFPIDFMFRLNSRRARFLRSQFVPSKGRGGRRYAPYAFTEHGVIMRRTS
ncbi:MAG: ORF6N domain-containing protein [Acidobacteria bacterium]|nr:ORF6N domain-containing protein [Acidobacteriota bacterium]